MLELSNAIVRPYISNSIITMTPRPHSQELTRDQRLQCRTLRELRNLSFDEIANLVGCTFYQARYACQAEQLTPRKQKGGRKPKLSPEQLDGVIQWIQQSPEHQFLNCQDICNTLGLDVCGKTLSLSLKSRGVVVHSLPPKPPIFEIPSIHTPEMSSPSS